MGSFISTSRLRIAGLGKRIGLLTCLMIGLLSLLMVGWSDRQIDITVDKEIRQVPIKDWILGDCSLSGDIEGPDSEWHLLLPGSWFWPGIKLSMAGSVPVAAEVAGYQLWSQVPTAPHILAQEGINLNAQDRFASNLDSKEANQYIKVTRVENIIELQQEEIAPTLVRRPERYLAVGEEKLLQEGQPGVRYHKYQVTLENGLEVERQLLASWVEVEPRPRVVVYGSRAYPEVAAREGETLTVIATAYTHTGNRTATGIWPYRGIVAVDPRVIPLGTRLYVDGYGYAVAQDTGGLIKGNRIDVFLDSEEEAIQWGRREVTIRILGN